MGGEFALFQRSVLDFYRDKGRSFVWRDAPHDPYAIVVSEIMLQQTQTDRVVPKFELFMKTFPTLESLAQAPLAHVIAVWQGLGYNRRALFVHGFARRVLSDFDGIIPNDPAILETFDGIGAATAGSICAFAYNLPIPFIETNIRSVFIHHFFTQEQIVRDSQILPLVEKTLYYANPRLWYYALTDYGVHLKKMAKNPSRRSAHHSKQSKFEGSNRQVRGMILKALVNQGGMSFVELCSGISREGSCVERNVRDLCDEGFIQEISGCFVLKA